MLTQTQFLKQTNKKTPKRTNYLSLMPVFQFLLVLLCYLLILSPHFLHDSGHILSFRGVNIHMDTTLGNLGTQFSNILLKGETVRE